MRRTHPPRVTGVAGQAEMPPGPDQKCLKAHSPRSGGVAFLGVGPGPSESTPVAPEFPRTARTRTRTRTRTPRLCGSHRGAGAGPGPADIGARGRRGPVFFHGDPKSSMTGHLSPPFDPAGIPENDGARPPEAPVASIWPGDDFFFDHLAPGPDSKNGAAAKQRAPGPPGPARAWGPQKFFPGVKNGDPDTPKRRFGHHLAHP